MNRTVIACLLLATTVASCGLAPGPQSPEPIHPAALVGSSWQLASMDGREIPPAITVVLRFGVNDLGGDAPCNGYGAGYAYDPTPGVLRIEPIVSTKRACLDQQSTTIEAGYLRELQAASVVTLDARDILLLDGSATKLTFIRWTPPAQSQDGPS